MTFVKVETRSLSRTATVRKRKGNRQWREAAGGYSMVAPVVVLFGVFYFIPLVETIIDGFYHFNLMSGTRHFAGLKNFQSIFENGDFRVAFWHTVVFAVFTVIFSTILSLFVAVLVNRKIRGRSIYRAIYFLPVIAPNVATSIVFTKIFGNDQTGVVNQFLSWFGIHPIAWLGDAHYAMFTVIVFSIWSLIGYYMIIFLAGLQNIPNTYYEAAVIDGANRWQLFRKITVPLLSPTTLFVVVIGVIQGFQVFNQVYILTQGGPLNATTVILYYIYQQAFVNFQGGQASAMSFILFIILLLLSILQIKLFSRKSA